MATTNVTTADFEQTVLDNDTVFVDFWASWCGPCRMFAPVYEQVSEADGNDGIVFAKVDTEAEQSLGAALDISAIPTLMAFRDGILVFRQAGALPRAQFESLVEQVKGLDMDQVAEQQAAEQQAAEQQAPAQQAAAQA